MKLFLLGLCIFFILFFPFWFVQVIAFIILLVITLSFMYSRLIYNNIHVSRSQHVIRSYRLQIIDIDLFISNKSLFPVHYVYVSESPGGFIPVTEGKFVLNLVKRQRVRLSYSLKSQVRGEYHLGPITVKSGDPLGLFPWEKKIEDFCRIIIYPGMFRVGYHITQGYPGGNIKTNDRTYEDVTRLKSVREYIPGDDIRHISWKLSARLGSLHTKEYLSSLHSPVLLVLNLSLEDYPLRHRYAHLERAIETAASLIVFYTSMKQEVGLLSSGFTGTIRPQINLGGGHDHAMLLLENLAVIKGSTDDTDIISLLNSSHLLLPNGVRIILIGPVLDGERIRTFAAFRRRRSFLEHIQIGGGQKTAVHPKISVYTLPDIGGASQYA
jgi:uncharacterized protein (DUF58 family)